jgi:hypothetical protein
MTAFWKNLHRLAQGQLFNGGYLVGPQAVAPKIAPSTPARPQKSALTTGNRLPHRQIAAFQ